MFAGNVDITHISVICTAQTAKRKCVYITKASAVATK